MAYDPEFQEWLQEPLEEGVTRSQILQKFVKDGLIPFLQSKRYHIACSERHFANCIATGLFENDGCSHLTSVWIGMPPRDTNPEEDAHTAFVLDSYAWDSFWAVWGNRLPELDPSISFRGQDRRMDIEAFVWECIDYDTSPQTDILYELLRGGDDSIIPPIRGATADTYLQESVEYNGWAGYRK